MIVIHNSSLDMAHSSPNSRGPEKVARQAANAAIFCSKPQMRIAALFWEAEFLRLPVETVTKPKSCKVDSQPLRDQTGFSANLKQIHARWSASRLTYQMKKFSRGVRADAPVRLAFLRFSKVKRQ